MAALSIVGLSGNVTRPSRTAVVVEAVLEQAVRQSGGQGRLVQLADAAPLVFSALTPDQLEGEGRALVQAIEAADALVIGTPVYRAAYTGALKHLFDLVQPNALAGKPVVLTATGGTSMHALVLEHHLRPLFAFFKTMTVPTTVFAAEADFRDYRIVNPAVADRIEQAGSEVAGALRARSLLEFDGLAPAGRLPGAL